MLPSHEQDSQQNDSELTDYCMLGVEGYLEGLADCRVDWHTPRGVIGCQVCSLLPPAHPPCNLTLLVQHPGIPCIDSDMNN